MALSRDTFRVKQLGDIEEYPVAAGELLYQGAAVGEDGNGYARALQAGDAFLGFTDDRIDNSGGGAAGDVNVRVWTMGRAVLPLTGVTITDNDGVAVYASDDGTFTTTASGNSLIGAVSRYEAAGQAIVAFRAAALQ